MQRRYFLTIIAVLVLLMAIMPIAAAAQSGTPAPAAAPAAPETVGQAVQRLNQDANGEVTFSYRLSLIHI